VGGDWSSIWDDVKKPVDLLDHVVATRTVGGWDEERHTKCRKRGKFWP
jgi:hypothetical protein